MKTKISKPAGKTVINKRAPTVFAPAAAWPYPTKTRPDNDEALDALLKLQRRVNKSLLDSSEDRNLRLLKASKIPKITIRETIVFNRNPDVVAEVLFQSNGVCHDCNREAPFKKKADGCPFLEVHHIITLADGGEDSVENAIAICPNCHRKRHYG